MWGLDDYQCLPFLWGSSQLANHPAFTPGSIHKEAALREGAVDYIYMAAIVFIKRVGLPCAAAGLAAAHAACMTRGGQQVKKGPLAEVSPMLNDISGLESWRKARDAAQA